MVVSRQVQTYFKSGSAIRHMFEEGLRLKARYGNDRVADLSIGNPEFEPPEGFIRALKATALMPGTHGYMPNAGYPEVRDQVARHLRERGFFPQIGQEHVLMTTGAAGALNVVLRTVLEPGDEVIVPRPYFIEYRYYVETHGGRLKLVDTAPDFELDVDQVAEAIDARTRAVLVTSPHNPTGRVYRRDTLVDLASLLRDRSRALGRPVLLISDEPYREILFGEPPYVSPASLYENSFMCYSWSKVFSIAGERIGYLAVQPAMELGQDGWPLLLGSLAMCNRFLGFVNAPAFMQRVIGRCLDTHPDLAHYAEKRERLCETLYSSGFEFAPPEGGFYVFPRCPEPEAAFVAHAREHLLLVVPGSAFGLRDYFRMSFACPTATLELACSKLAELRQA